MSKPTKQQQHSPVPMKKPQHRDSRDEGTEADKKGSTVVGQPELTGRNNPIRQKGTQGNNRSNNAEPYTD
ncbi:MAG TPA: hypothetical protein VK750_06110 [Cytophagaceae bacterium]|nr:hypothetical protein [Cytophagaceae bacterium]